MSNPKIKKDYRLIWFQHLHKAAGTSIVRLAFNNGENLYPQHGNGNPFSSDGRLIPLWNLDAYGLKRFVDHCQEMGITFVATEYGAPNFKYLSDDTRVTLITCLRNPYDRFVSDFRFSYYRGDTDKSTPERYLNSSTLSSMDNYYCRIFSQHCKKHMVIEDRHYQLAKRSLKLFNYCIVLEEPEPLKKLSRFLGWEGKELHENRNKIDCITILRQIAKGKPQPIVRRLLHKRNKSDQGFMEFFNRTNYWDFKIYREWYQLSASGKNRAADFKYDLGSCIN